jgi:hypothetical protein
MDPMRLAPRLLLPAIGLAVAAALAGCSTEASSPATPTATEARTPTPSPASTPEADDLAACDAFSEVMLPAQDVVDALLADNSGKTIDRSQLSSVVQGFRKAEASATPALYVKLHPAANIFYVIDGLFAGTESNQTLDTGGYRDGTIATLQYCTDTVGYHKPSS